MANKKEQIPPQKEKYSNDDQAKFELVKSLINPADDRISEFTLVDRRAILHLSIQIMRELAIDKDRIRHKKPLSQVWRTAWLRLKRSQDKWFSEITAGLAHEQISATAEAEEEASEKEWE